MFAPVGSLGDILAISKLIHQISLELRSIPGSATEYQDLLNELEALERALKQIYQIRPGVHELKRLDAIRAVATTCLIPLEEFLQKIQKFNKPLGIWNYECCRLKKIGSGMQWSFVWKDEIKKLRSVLTPKVSTILVLLVSQTIESLTKAELDRASEAKDISSRFFVQQILLERMEKSNAKSQSNADARVAGLTKILQVQADKVTELQSKTDAVIHQGLVSKDHLDKQNILLHDIHEYAISSDDQIKTVSTDIAIVRNDLASLKADTRSVLDFTAKMMEAMTQGFAKLQRIAEIITDLLRLTRDLTRDTMQIMLHLLREFWEIRQQLTRIERYLPKQMHYPMILFRDAFNNVTPFPYHVFRQWEGARRMVAAIFVGQPGLLRVEMGQWFVTHVGRGTRIDTRFWDKAVQPGDELSMTMIFEDVKVTEGFCPYPSCGAVTSSAEIIRGGRFCPQCFRFSQFSQNKIVGTPKIYRLHDNEAKVTRFSLPGAHSRLSESGHDDIDEYFSVEVVKTILFMKANQQESSENPTSEEEDSVDGFYYVKGTPRRRYDSHGRLTWGPAVTDQHIQSLSTKLHQVQLEKYEMKEEMLEAKEETVELKEELQREKRRSQLERRERDVADRERQQREDQRRISEFPLPTARTPREGSPITAPEYLHLTGY